MKSEAGFFASALWAAICNSSQGRSEWSGDLGRGGKFWGRSRGIQDEESVGT